MNHLKRKHRDPLAPVKILAVIALVLAVIIKMAPTVGGTDEHIDLEVVDSSGRFAPKVSRYDEISLTAHETELLARIVWAEARGESLDGQQAVVEVVFNRLLSEDFPDTLEEVIYEPGQFAGTDYLHIADPCDMQYKAIGHALNGPNILPLEVVFFSVEPQNEFLWGRIGGHAFCYPWDWEG